MHIAHEHRIPWTPTEGVRGGVIEFKTMLEGEEGSPDNFALMLANTDVSFKSPRHRHNFDQIRLGLTASTNIGPRRNLEPGDLAYFPEGTYYGPQNQEETGEGSVCMVVQFGGPSGSGYMSKRELFEGFRRLQQQGEFAGGVFRRHAPAEGERKNQDSYEAIWELHNGRPIAYASPRYLEPVLIRHTGFAWQPDPERPGVARKHLGSFTERDIAVTLLRLDAGVACVLPPSAQGRLLFCCAGEGDIEPAEGWSLHTALHLAPGEAPALRARTVTEFLMLQLPRLEP